MTVPMTLTRGQVSVVGIAPGRPVAAGSQWSDMAKSANWLVGKGSCLVPLTNPAATVPKSGSATFRFRVRPRALAIARQWSVLVRCLDPDEAASVTLTAGTGSATYAVPGIPTTSPLPAPDALVVVDNLASRVSTEGEISVTVAAGAGGDVVVTGIECIELDRVVMPSDSTSYGTQTETIRPREPILHLANSSVRGVYDALAASDARRIGIWHLPLATAITNNSATYAGLTLVPVAIQAPKLNVGASTGQVKWAAYARMATSGGSGGAVRLTTSTSGVSDVAPVTATSFAWTTTRTIAISCDDFGVPSLLKQDLLTAELAGDGTRTCEVLGVSMWVDSVA